MDVKAKAILYWQILSLNFRAQGAELVGGNVGDEEVETGQGGLFDLVDSIHRTLEKRWKNLQAFRI